MSKLLPNDMRILSVLAEIGSECEPMYFPFKPISQKTGLERSVVRRIVRRLARKGYTEFCKGLWSEDGEPAGAGYAITPEGRKVLETQ